jgi:tetratricopeptide (TPR) repeat protein
MAACAADVILRVTTPPVCLLLECAFVALRVILCALLLTAFSSAQTIVLKNGRTITADRVRVEGGRVHYSRGDDTYAIPESLVERIEEGSGGLDTGHGAGGPFPAYIPPEAPLGEIAGWDQLQARLIRNGRLDTDALAAIESQGPADLAAAAFYLAGRYEHSRGDREGARRHLQRSLSYMPDSHVVLTHLAVVLVQLRRPAEALPYAERATREAPDSADAFAALGYAYFAADRTRDAVRAWRRSLELRPDAALQQRLDAAERELAAESTFSQTQSAHFTLRYEGKQAARLGRAILDALEEHYNDLVRELGAAPRQSIPVILYTEQKFFDVTRAPAWMGAVNDGRLRIPIDGVESVTPALSRVLRHELVHSFVNQITGGRCPQWLNEGLAQLLEPSSSGARGAQLSRLFQARRHIPFTYLEASWFQFSPEEAVTAYAQSLAAVEYIHATYGISQLRRLLQLLGQGSSIEAALRFALNSSYARLEDDITRYLQRTYGD